MIKFRFILTIFLFLHFSNELIGQEKLSNVTIIKMSEQNMYNLKDSFLLALNPVILKEGNWTKNDLLEFSRHFKYEDYLKNINYIKEKIDALKNYKSIIETKESDSGLIIKTSFETKISKKGYITQIVKYHLFKDGEVIIKYTDWKGIKKELKSR